mmetsp:Transcript_26835/g.40297  ORF Transcript_26835/g.40297 Transcript_26835/m.40297 type:complete len:181 (+) Transcript_26835:1553-2095(+)
MPFFLVIAKKDPSAYKEYSIIPNATSVFQKICSMSYGTPDIAIIGIWLDGVNEIAGCSTSPTSSPAPTTETKEIQWVGDPCNSVFPQTGKCAECTGDCDHDSDCEDGLVCYQRNIGDVNVPGCTWGSNNALLINHPGDYCRCSLLVFGQLFPIISHISFLLLSCVPRRQCNKYIYTSSSC